MTFDAWYEKNIKKGQNWSLDHKTSHTYKTLKKAYYHGMRTGINLKPSEET